MSVYAGRKRAPSDSESRSCLKILSYFPIAIYLYFTARSSAAPVFRAKHHHFPRYPPHASSHAASHHRGPARITLQQSTRGNRVPTGHITTPSARPHASLRLPHTCSCHQHVTAWTPTRHSCADHIDDTWSVTSAATQLEHRCPLRVKPST